MSNAKSRGDELSGVRTLREEVALSALQSLLYAGDVSLGHVVEKAFLIADDFIKKANQYK